VGGIVTGLVVLLMVVDGSTKVVRVAQVVRHRQVGSFPGIGRPIGALLLACTTIYVIPQTAVLGAILLTGYLGGATAIHVRAGSGWFRSRFRSRSACWRGWGWSCEPRLLWTILLRQ
jgi:hypothetical protein